MVDIEVKIHGATETAKYVRTVATRLPKQVRLGMKISMQTIRDIIIPITPVGYPGSPDKLVESYRNKIEGSGDDETIGTFYSEAPDAKVASIELGRSPGTMPPLDALLPWVQHRFGGDMRDAVAVGLVIRDRGIPGVLMFEQAAERARDPIFGEFEKAVERAMQ